MDSSGSRLLGDRLRSLLSSEPWVMAVFRNGSTVVGTDQPGSDVDFTVLVREPRDRARALALLKRRFRFLGMDHGVPTFAGRRKIGITLLDRATVEDLLRHLYRSPEDLLERQAAVQHKIVEAVAVHDPQGLLKVFERRAAAYPRRIRRAVVARSLRSLETAYGEWGFRNEFQYAVEMPRIIEDICLNLYARNGRLMMMPLKRIHKDVRELKPDIGADLLRLVRGGRTARSRSRGKQALGRILTRLRADPPG